MEYPLSEFQAKNYLQYVFDNCQDSFIKIQYSEPSNDDSTLELLIDGKMRKHSIKKELGNVINGQTELSDSEEFKGFDFVGEIMIIDDECKLVSILNI